ncbi:MAG: peptide chain release factor N(5)-glutamine methyltransferase [Eubacteriales bacterium]|nr:peptide chain release factor N(5)-glutamine methyltransferase [Eubacteriales bacterium]
MAKTYNDLYLHVRRSLRDAGVEAHALEARLLVAYAAEKRMETLLCELRLYTTDEIAERVEELLNRRLAGEPAAYITKSWEFFGLPFYVNPSVLIPRMDTELLVQTALECLQGRETGARILDLCAGSGCVGCALAHSLPSANVVLADISKEALIVCQKNIELNHLENRISCLETDALQPPSVQLGSFDLIVSNPPYIATEELRELDVSVRDYEPHLALDGGEDGLRFYRAILSNWLPLLRNGGHILFEVGETQAEDVRRLMLLAGLHGTACFRDTGDIDRVVAGKR